MKTRHEVILSDATSLAVPEGSVQLVVTSPPYPMIEMWDAIFSEQDGEIASALAAADGWRAFRRMHRILDAAWREIHRVLAPGGIACINVGDATRTIGGHFALYPNHAHVAHTLVELGFTPLPTILWRKQTNAPNKFMGSGMLPPGAYVTLEHEHVLIARKGGKREFRSDDAKANRRRSAFFWEERNRWFSDVWFDLKGMEQRLDAPALRERSGAFPFELPYRLVNMFSVLGDTVLDPFAGTGTTLLAAIASGRNSIGIELDRTLATAFRERVAAGVAAGRRRIDRRLADHRDFVTARHEAKGRFGYRNACYGFPVVTRQEVELRLPVPTVVDTSGAVVVAEYDDHTGLDECAAWTWFFDDESTSIKTGAEIPKS